MARGGALATAILLILSANSCRKGPRYFDESEIIPTVPRGDYYDAGTKPDTRDAASGQRAPDGSVP